MEMRGMKLNMNKIKLLVSGKNNQAPAGKYPCAGVIEGSAQNSIQCSSGYK